MVQVYIWGAGDSLHSVMNEIDDSRVEIMGIVDSDEKKQGMMLFDGIPVISPQELYKKIFDYIVISVKKYESIENECKKLNISLDKIIVYWKANFEYDIFKNRANRIDELIKENRILKYKLDSAPYEWGGKESPKILEGVSLLKKIIKDGSSLCRFGDGEFNIMRGKKCSWFQDMDYILRKRLKDVLLSQEQSINIAIAQNFTGFEKYKEDAVNDIRRYMFGDMRKFILGLLSMHRIYYDAYVTRPYIIYRNSENADKIFPLFRRIWEDKDVVIIEGEYSRIGVGNDLMKEACSISRILCPLQNAWNRYEEILEAVLEKVPKTALICISLGPCATVLAYDLAKNGYQALDIGQLDNEYEWYLRGVKKRIAIQGKMVAEISEKQIFEMPDATEYFDQIIAKIV